jgi:hypothetical protein
MSLFHFVALLLNRSLETSYKANAKTRIRATQATNAAAETKSSKVLKRLQRILDYKLLWHLAYTGLSPLCPLSSPCAFGWVYL